MTPKMMTPSCSVDDWDGEKSAVPATAFVALGANMGEVMATLRQARRDIAALPKTQIIASSSIYRTAPQGAVLDQPDFMNAVVQLSTRLSPHDLLAHLLSIEARHGRVRTVCDGPRSLDLDILLYDTIILNDEVLCVPHPRLHQRAFVLVPLLEIAPDICLPGSDRHSLRDDLLACRDQPIERVENFK